jgi:hypothetical protein
MFDLKNDPHEIPNVYVRSKYKSKQKELHQLLAKLQDKCTEECPGWHSCSKLAVLDTSIKIVSEGHHKIFFTGIILLVIATFNWAS